MNSPYRWLAIAGMALTACVGMALVVGVVLEIVS